MLTTWQRLPMIAPSEPDPEQDGPSPEGADDGDEPGCPDDPRADPWATFSAGRAGPDRITGGGRAAASLRIDCGAPDPADGRAKANRCPEADRAGRSCPSGGLTGRGGSLV